MLARWLAFALALALGMASRPGAAADSCYDRKQNGPESDVDCGGDCPACELGRSCSTARDCATGLCADGECVERPYEDGDPVPPGYDVETARTDGAATARSAGYLVFGIGYAGAYVGALALPGRLSWLYVPIIGPWMALSQRDQETKGLWIADGILQGGGAVLILGGVLSAGKTLVRTPATEVSVSPMLVPGRIGLDISGRF